MLNCRHVTRLVSQAMDARLPWHQRLAVRIHLLYCVWCRRYATQLHFLRRATKELAVEPAETAQLSGSAREAMHRRLQEALRGSEPPAK